MGPPGPAPPRRGPLYVQRQDSDQEPLYENATPPPHPAEPCWWRCRRAQTLEFHSRARTVPRAARVLRVCGVRGVRLGLSASCAALAGPSAGPVPVLLSGPSVRPVPVLLLRRHPARCTESTESDDD